MTWLAIIRGILGLDINERLRDELLMRVAEEEQRATEKMANKDYWRNVGDLEMAAIRDIRECILNISEKLPPPEYRWLVVEALQDLAKRWRANEEDEDGYGLGTVHAVGNVLPEYLG